MLDLEFFTRDTNISAKVICDSISEDGVRLTTFEIEYPRFILAELNTHRCLVGDTLLSFDLPYSIENGGRRKYNMTMKDFHDKWHNGSKPRKSKPFKDADLGLIKDEEVYTCKQLSKLLDLSVSNLRTLCRKGKLESINSEGKLRSEDYKILGKVFIEYRENQRDNVFSVKHRLKNMKLRFYNTDTGRIENTTITDIWSNGVERVYDLKVEGSSLRGTGNHPILTQRGWVQLKDVTLDDFVYTSKKSVSEDNRKDPKRFQNINGMWRCQWQRDFKRKYVEEFGSVCSSCGVTSELDVHHIVPVYKDPSIAFDETNVVCICTECHANAHREQGWQADNYAELIGVLTKVVSVEDTGEYEEVFDLTVQHEQHNFLANDIVVHNCLSKNSSSSRAIPIKKMLSTIEDNMAVPVYWGKAKSGMQADGEVDEDDVWWYEEKWKFAYDEVSYRVEQLSDLVEGKKGFMQALHKQVPNRLIEPFQMMKTVITGTDWENFFNLRIHCLSDDTEILTTQGWKLIGNVQEGEEVYSLNMVNGTLEKSKVVNTVSKKSEGTAISMRGQSVDLLMSLKHNVVHVEDGVLKKSLAEDLVGKKITVPKSVNTQHVFDETGYDYSEGFITGFALGNGNVYHKKQSGNRGLTVCKGGKQSEVALDKFKSACTVVYPKNKIHTHQRTSTILELDGKNVYEDFEKLLSDSAIHKELPSNLFEQPLDFLKGLFDGLLYSDGNILNRSGGLKFYTSSKHLADGFQELSLILGYSSTVSESNRIGRTSEGVDSLGKLYKITTKNVSYTCHVNLNRNEPTLKQPLEEVQYNGMFKCVTLDTNGTIYARRNGKAVWTGNCDAQPEICMLAYKMYKAMEYSKPIELKVGEWHLPYVETEHWGEDIKYFVFEVSFDDDQSYGMKCEKYLTLEEAIKISAASCASVSYRTEGMTLEKADKIFNMLIKAEVVHSSPLEHCATPVKPKFNELGKVRVNCSEPQSWEDGITHMNIQGQLCSGNLRGFIQYRHLLPNNTSWEFDFQERMKLFK